MRPDALCAAATSAAALAILLDTNVSNEDCLLLSMSSISIGCSISKAFDTVESVTFVEFDVIDIEAVETIWPTGVDDDEFEVDDEFEDGKNSSLSGVGVLDLDDGGL